jgi:hypothetical protein
MSKQPLLSVGSEVERLLQSLPGVKVAGQVPAPLHPVVHDHNGCGCQTQLQCLAASRNPAGLTKKAERTALAAHDTGCP